MIVEPLISPIPGPTGLIGQFKQIFKTLAQHYLFFSKDYYHISSFTLQIGKKLSI